MILLIRALGYGSQALFNDRKKLLLVTTQAKTQNLWEDFPFSMENSRNKSKNHQLRGFYTIP